MRPLLLYQNLYKSGNVLTLAGRHFITVECTSCEENVKLKITLYFWDQAAYYTKCQEGRAGTQGRT